MRIVSCSVLVLACLVPALAQSAGENNMGVRVGVTDDPDQVVVGGQWDLGHLFEMFRFVPHAELGFGDDASVLAVTAPAVRRFPLDMSFVPYAGAGITAGVIDFDDDRGDGDTEFEVGAKVLGGLEWDLERGRTVFVELNVGFGDLHDIELIGGITFPFGPQ
jgi:hypothetical protein